MALEITEHTYDIGLRGDSHSQAVGVCEISEWKTVVAALLGASDGIAPYLRCNKIRARPLNNDWASGKMELTLDFAPLFSIDALTIDLPFKWKMQSANECVTVHGGYHWKSDGSGYVNRRILPVKRFAMAKIVLYGTRSTLNLATYDALIEHVNSDTFLGAAPGTMFFETMSLEQHMLLDGTIVFAVELHLIYKSSGWNIFFRENFGEDKPDYDTLLDQKGNPVYPSAVFAPLLA